METSGYIVAVWTGWSSGVIGTAVVVGVISSWIIERTKAKTIRGGTVSFRAKPFSEGRTHGGLMFGIGRAITGTSHGPLFAPLGAGSSVVIVRSSARWPASGCAASCAINSRSDR